MPVYGSKSQTSVDKGSISPTSPTKLKSWQRSFSQGSLFRRNKGLQRATMVLCRVVLLDQETFDTEVSKGALGQELFENVKTKLELEEADYFGLSYRNTQNVRFWLNLDKRIDKQLEHKSSEQPVLYWEVKFYPPAPEIVNEDLTRYLIVLQVRQDVFTGRLPASFQSLAILGSYTVQGELGDFDRNVHVGINYLKKYSFAPNQSDELLMRIADLHKTRKGLTPAEADLYFLDNAKKMALYGMDKYPVKDSNSHEVLVGVSASGLYLYDDKLRMDSFKWPRIIKISYKRNIFFVKVRPGEYEKHEKVHGFKLPNPKMAKRLWRIAVEHHQFFRLNQPELTDSKTLGGFGPRRWRMSGRTQAQLKNVGTPRKSFSRSNSIMSTDTLSNTHHYGTGTLPLPGNRRDMDGAGQYNTFGQIEDLLSRQPHIDDRQSTEGRRNEKMVHAYDENGRPYDYMNDSSMSRNHDGSLSRGPGYPSEDDILNGLGYNPETGAMEGAGTLGRHNGGNDYEQYEDLNKQAPSPAPVANMYGAGDLPLPFFSSESAGVAANGMLDDSQRLDSSERGEKVIRMGVLPTVQTTSVKFDGVADLSTHSTWSPPIVKTESHHFHYPIPDDLDKNNSAHNYVNHSNKRISERDTRMDERNSYSGNGSKHKIILSGDADLDEQMLLNAIQAVTGLNPNLGVDRIEIKTEEEST